MTRQETIAILFDIADDLDDASASYEALEKAIKVLSEMSDDEYEYLTFEINCKGE